MCLTDDRFLLCLEIITLRQFVLEENIKLLQVGVLFAGIVRVIHVLFSFFCGGCFCFSLALCWGWADSFLFLNTKVSVKISYRFFLYC